MGHELLFNVTLEAKQIAYDSDIKREVSAFGFNICKIYSEFVRSDSFGKEKSSSFTFLGVREFGNARDSVN